MLDPISENDVLYERAADQAVELANTLADDHPDGDLPDIADGVLAGAVHYWLFSRKPCGDAQCEDCAPIATGEGRLAVLLSFIEECAQTSDLYHQPEDANVGRA